MEKEKYFTSDEMRDRVSKMIEFQGINHDVVLEVLECIRNNTESISLNEAIRILSDAKSVLLKTHQFPCSNELNHQISQAITSAIHDTFLKIQS